MRVVCTSTRVGIGGNLIVISEGAFLTATFHKPSMIEIFFISHLPMLMSLVPVFTPSWFTKSGFSWLDRICLKKLDKLRRCDTFLRFPRGFAMDKPFWFLFLILTVYVAVVVLRCHATEPALGHNLGQCGDNYFLSPHHLHNIEILVDLFTANIVYPLHP